jgi:hypothetical protein
MEVLMRYDMAEVLEIRLTSEVGRNGNLEVWL